MSTATAKRYIKVCALEVLGRLPRPLQLRLYSELAALLGDPAAKDAPVLRSFRPATDHALPAQDAVAIVPDICAGMLTALPVAERLASVRQLLARMDVKEADILGPLLNSLPRPESVAMFQQLAGRLGVSLTEASGANGRLAGYLDDEGVFLPYLRDRAWFLNGVEFINSIFLGCVTGTFIDVGANIGAVVVPVARANPSVDCFAFEPEPQNFFALTHNIARNEVGKNVKAYEMALADADGTVAFELSDSNFGDHRVHKSASMGTPLFGEEGRATIKVDAGRLDRVLSLSALARPIVAKIDVQGAEPMVLAGDETILREAEMLVIEYWPYGIRRLDRDPVDFLKTLSEIFPFVARVGEQTIAPSDFVPFAAMRAELEAFAQKRTWMHLNLALTKRPVVELAARR